MLSFSDASSIQDKYHATRVDLTDRQRILVTAMLEEPFPHLPSDYTYELIRAYIRKIMVEGSTKQHPYLSPTFDEEELLCFAAAIGWKTRSEYWEWIESLTNVGLAHNPERKYSEYVVHTLVLVLTQML